MNKILIFIHLYPLIIELDNAPNYAGGAGLDWNWTLMHDSISSNVQYKFTAPIDISSLTKLTFNAHGTDTLNVCFMEANYGTWKGFWTVDEYGDSTEIGAITGGVCFRAKLNATDSAYAFDLTKVVTTARNLSKDIGHLNYISRTGGISEETIQLYWDYIKHNTRAIEIRSGIIANSTYKFVDVTYTKETVTNIQLK